MSKCGNEKPLSDYAGVEDVTYKNFKKFGSWRRVRYKMKNKWQPLLKRTKRYRIISEATAIDGMD